MRTVKGSSIGSVQKPLDARYSVGGIPNHGSSAPQSGEAAPFGLRSSTTSANYRHRAILHQYGSKQHIARQDGMAKTARFFRTRLGPHVPRDDWHSSGFFLYTCIGCVWFGYSTCLSQCWSSSPTKNSGSNRGIPDSFLGNYIRFVWGGSGR